jgi:cystathionine beta-synthase
MEKQIQENLDMKDYQVKHCTWTPTIDKSQDPHLHSELKPIKKIYNNILEAIHHTPLVRLTRIPQSEGIQCEILAKCEYLNPGGSLKDRIGKRMIEDAERREIIKPGFTLIEATSGNTGIGLAMAGAVKGYNVLITLPEKMSQEKSDVLSALGANVIRTPSEATFVDIDSHIGVARKMNKEIPNSIILDQVIDINIVL